MKSIYLSKITKEQKKNHQQFSLIKNALYIFNQLKFLLCMTVLLFCEHK